MNATSAACCAGADDDDDDEDGEAADMEGTSQLYLAGKQASRFDCTLAHVFGLFRIRGKWPVGNGRGRRCKGLQHIFHLRVICYRTSTTLHIFPLSRRPWTPVKW